jgi:pre-rRNA-processing protein TSR4
MPPYDSDSSDGEDDYTETNVLLGYAATEPTSDIISHIGGQPVGLLQTPLEALILIFTLDLDR